MLPCNTHVEYALRGSLASTNCPVKQLSGENLSNMTLVIDYCVDVKQLDLHKDTP